ncbi:MULTISPECIES: alpha-N-arabinofuranosidase [unclassified Caulobacter]|uniref:alpha-N-arabinofuranosidase n=1 Tax=unclassified Caulobacter TaxID=2648921 RepID=UPI0006FB7CC0|nr:MULTISPECIES: alpha-L-arabinofuranosidase C-terminal domain-containing protein [unclassified Caulobacter]KQV55890.1 alpha-N-arabinofuranosidase [Caulobacter sp. Root342]KQV70936.1 alpha-N-arabinofuranosidase [Caulobacter sp. Root343]
MRPFGFAAPLVIAAAMALSAQAATPEITVTADAAKPGPVINRNILGQFAEHLGRGVYEGVWVGPDSKIPNTRGVRNDVVGALKALKIPNVRWPGGCYADEYHWKKGVGKDRPATINSSWGGVLETNAFGTHEFMDFVDQIGSRAYVSVNVGAGTPQEAADWLEYMTTDQPTELGKLRAANGRDKPYTVAMLGLGNESWGCGGSMTAAEYVHDMRRFSNFAKNYNPAQKTGDQKMLKIAVGPDRDDYAWTETVMQAWSKKVWSWDIDGLSLHSYTWPKASEQATGFDEAKYASLLKTTLWMEELVSKHVAIMDKYDPEKKVGLFVDEWGTWFKVEDGAPGSSLYQQSTQRDAIVAALNLNIFARHADRVKGANVAQMVNVLQAMVLTSGEKMLLTPTYHVFRMYTPFQDARFVPLAYDAGTYKAGDVSLPRLDAVAAVGKDGKLWLSLTNLDPNQPLRIDAAVAGYVAAGAKGETLSGDQMGSFNTFEAPTRVAPKPIAVKASGKAAVLELPPHSVTVIGLDPAK